MRKFDRPPLTLHEAMAVVLRDCPEQTAEQVYLANEIQRRNLYWQTDGSPVKLSQIGPRAKNYPQLFEKISADPASGARARVRLRLPKAVGE